MPEGGALGVDLGITNLATDSEGEHFTGAVIRIVRGRYHLRRQRLQKVRHTKRETPSAPDAPPRIALPERHESLYQQAARPESRRIAQGNRSRRFVWNP